MQTRRTISIVLFVVLLFAFSSVSILASNAYAPPTSQSTSTTVSTSPCESQVLAADNAIDKSIAINNAESSQYYTSEQTSGVQLSYTTNYVISKWTDSSCSVTVESMNVVFSIQNSTGFAGYLVVTENPTTLSPTGSQIQTPGPVAGGYPTNCTKGGYCQAGDWSGYEGFGNSGATDSIQQIDFYYNQPKPSYPTSTGGCPNANWGSYTECNVFVWSGLENGQGGYPDLAQAGTEAFCKATGSPLSCTTIKYYGFFELYPQAAAVTCTSTYGNLAVNGGDTIYAVTTNEAALGGSNTKYDFYISDSTTSTSCSSTGNVFSALSNPTMGAFILENAYHCNYAQPYTTACDALAEFPTVTFSTNQIYDATTGSYYNLYTLFSNGYYYQDWMVNFSGNSYTGSCGSTPYANAYPNSVTSSNTWTDVWSSSQYANFAFTGC